MQLMTKKAPRVLALRCSPPNSQTHTPRTLCVQASPNPEFAKNPSNFAHWLLAHVHPLVAALLAADVQPRDIFTSQLLIAHGQNRALPRWVPQFVQFFGPDATCTKQNLAFEANTTTDFDRSHNCARTVRISVPVYSFCRPQFWATPAWRRVGSALAAQLHQFTSLSASAAAATSMAAAAAAATAGRIVVVTRPAAKERHVLGLQAACNLTTPLVSCVTLSKSLPLAHVARLFGPGVGGIVAGHGAALANLLFAAPGARLAEIDNIRSVEFARNFYQQLATALGLRPFKVWLDGDGQRFCPPTVLGCPVGASPGYRSNVRVLPGVLRDVLREVASGDHVCRPPSSVGTSLHYAGVDQRALEAAHRGQGPCATRGECCCCVQEGLARTRCCHREACSSRQSTANANAVRIATYSN